MIEAHALASVANSFVHGPAIALSLSAGWSYQKKGLQTRQEGKVTIYGIPYSEHSSFAELRDCVKRLRPKRIIPTVNCPDAASARAIVDRFADLMDLSKDKSRLDSYFGRTASAPVTVAAGDDSHSELTAHEACSHLDAQCPQLDAVHAVKTECQGPPTVSAAQAQQNNILSPGSMHKQILVQADARADGLVKREEEEKFSSFDWEDAAVCSPSFEAKSCQHCFDTDVEDQSLPMRSHPVPAHAHSAPAVLSPPSRATDPKLGSSARQSLPVHDSTMPAATATLNQSNSAETDRYNLAGSERTGQQAAACLTGIAPASCPTQEVLPIQKPVLSNSQCEQPGSCLAKVLQPCLSLLDDVDIAEQSRLLCAIQQHRLYAKHCLTSKKRQMTLGDFVAPKRLK